MHEAREVCACESTTDLGNFIKSKSFLDESIALVEFSKHSRRDCVESVAYAHVKSV